MKLAITGATSGIGAETVKALAPHFKEIFLLVRNEEKARKMIPGLMPQDKSTVFHTVHCDLTDLKSVAAAAEHIKGKTGQLDVLINNAGGVYKDRKLTKDGFESGFSINHLGHFLLTMKLLPLIEASPLARIINVSSEAHKVARPDFEDLQSESSYSAFVVYANVKLFNILFTRSLAEKYGDKGIRAFALHPGMVSTEFGKGLSKFIQWGKYLIKPFMISAEKGARTSIFLAIDPSVIHHNGGYFKKSKPAKASKAADSPELREKLWQLSENLVKDFL